MDVPILKSTGYYNNEELPLFGEDFLSEWSNNELFVKFKQGNLLECQARAYIFSGNVNGHDPYGISEYQKLYSK